MFKDYKKYLSTSLKVYLFVLVIVFIHKIVGLDYFGIDLDNSTINNICLFLEKYNLDKVIEILLLFFYSYIMISVSLNNKEFKIVLYSIIISILDIILQIVLSKFHIGFIRVFIEVPLWIIFFIFTGNKDKIKKLLLVIILNIFFQYISVLTRSNNNILYLNNFILEIILNLDYILLMLILFTINFSEGGILCGQEVGSYLQKKVSLKKSLTRLQKRFQDSLKKFKKNFKRNLKKFKEKDKVERLTIIIYIILSIIWNTLSVIVILIVAKINGTIVECIFILSSFWLSKRSFGKPFHLNSMIQCFIVSNLSYFILNRVTTPLGISIFIPILLGVGLSYVSSKFVRKTYKPLYRGMPEEEFENTILKVVDKDSQKYKICKEFYIDKVSDLSLSFKYNYSVSGIRKIKDRINEKIKGLN